VAAAAAGQDGRPIAGLSPWRLAGRRLRANKVALASVVVFALIVATSLAAPWYAKHVAGTGPNTNHLTDTIEVGGKRVDVVSPDGTPVGPGLHRKFLLGADGNGRDVMVRLLYGGRNSLFIGFLSALITIGVAVPLGLVAGYFRGLTDRFVSGFFDVMWSFPVLLFAIALGTALAVNGLHLGPIDLQTGSLLIPAFVIGIVYVPYLGRPIRGQVLSLREKEFVEAAVAQGMPAWRILLSEVLPNVSTTVLVFGTLIVANNILTEASLSFLGAGVQAPNPSWGTLVADGAERLVTAPHLAIVPGIVIVLTVLSLNLFGDGLRDALDPRAKVRLR
jgi:peptide/nickel transport system permease protein